MGEQDRLDALEARVGATTVAISQIATLLEKVANEVTQLPGHSRLGTTAWDADLSAVREAVRRLGQ